MLPYAHRSVLCAWGREDSVRRLRLGLNCPQCVKLELEEDCNERLSNEVYKARTRGQEVCLAEISVFMRGE